LPVLAALARQYKEEGRARTHLERLIREAREAVENLTQADIPLLPLQHRYVPMYVHKKPSRASPFSKEALGLLSFF